MHISVFITPAMRTYEFVFSLLFSSFCTIEESSFILHNYWIGMRKEGFKLHKMRAHTHLMVILYVGLLVLMIVTMKSLAFWLSMPHSLEIA